MHICIVGQTGSGKSVLSQKFIHDAIQRGADKEPLPSEHLYSTVPLEGHDIPCTLVAATREEAKAKGIPWMYEVTCGVLFIDEMHKYLPARGYDKLPQEAMDFWTTHRHKDLHIISNTQHVSFVDKICRIITDRVYLCDLRSWPLVGYAFNRCVRPPDPCRCPPAASCLHARRDALGDRRTKLRHALGFGAIIFWNEYPPSILNDTESLDMAYLEEQKIKKRSSGFLLFDMKWADRARHTTEDSRKGHMIKVAPLAKPPPPPLPF